MKSILTALLLLNFSMIYAQTTITTAYPPLATTFSTGVTAVTFSVRNNNAFPVILTNITNLQGPLFAENGYKLYYSTTSQGGVPYPAAPYVYGPSTWLGPISSDSVFSTTVFNSFVTPFDCIGLTIPANTTYRFALQGTKGTSVRGATATPNIFSGGGVDLLVGNFAGVGGNVGYFTWDNLGWNTPYFFDGSITVAPLNTYTDIQVKSITLPNANSICNANNQNVSAIVCNKSTQTYNFATNNVNVNFNITGPGSPQTASLNLNSGTLAPCNCINATISNIDFSNGGTYYANATATVSGVTDANLTNNSRTDSTTNYKPTVSPLFDTICQYSNGASYAGFTSSGCQPIKKKMTINTLVNTPVAIDGSSDATATQFAIGGLPGLPDGAVITGGRLIVSNLDASVSGTYGEEARFNIYGPAPNGPSNPFVPGIAGSFLQFSVYNFEYSVSLTDVQLNAMYAALGAGGNFSIGYWESFDDIVGGSDVTLNAQTFPTTAKIFVDYTISPQPKWYIHPSLGASISTASNFNPFLVPGSGITNTNNLSTTTFYAACSADTTCRVAVNLTIKPSPIALQDSLASCELIASSGSAIFDLNTLNSSINNGGTNPVTYYQNANLSTLITNPGNFSSSSTILYSRVDTSNGCYSSDSVILTVLAKPEFSPALVTKNICAPGVVSLPSLIGAFSTVPPGTDTFYFADAACTIPTTAIQSNSGTSYMLFKTNTIPSCTDTATAVLSISPLSDEIVNQVTPGGYSDCLTPIACDQLMLTDGVVQTLLTTDCKRVATVTDAVNGISLGATEVCETIDCTIQTHNGQPYANRVYKITPTTNDSGYVCLYYLNDDFDQYNAYASANGWPLLPLLGGPVNLNNIAVSRVENGPLTTIGSFVGATIPSNLITSSYDPISTVWTICFPTDSFSHFYIHSLNPSNIPLPVSLLFSAKKIEQEVLLNWTTLKEDNNSHFVLERSKDGKNFSPISGKILSKAPLGNSQVKLDYIFKDGSPLIGHNYYRLAQYDLDGQFNYSQVEDIYFGNDIVIQVFPNPVQTILTLDIQTPKSSWFQTKIIDVTGRIVRRTDIQIQAGQHQVELDLKDLADGIYQIQVSNGKSLNYIQSFLKH